MKEVINLNFAKLKGPLLAERSHIKVAEDIKSTFQNYKLKNKLAK